MILLLYACGGTSGDSAAPASCPEGMSLLPADPAWCVDTYEVVVTDGVARSVAGEVPTWGVSFVDARAVCEATGEAAGDERHLVTRDEWRDAGDGVVGEGGTTWPWGDTWDADRCVVPADDGTLTVDATQPAGSKPDCKSAFGLYDQIGNLWEWVDPGYDVDIAAFVARRAAEGVTVTLREDGVGLDVGVPPGWVLGLAGVPEGVVERDQAGLLWVSLAGATGFPPDGIHGHLMPPAPEQGDFLPVTLRVEGDVGWLVPEADRDGEPVTAKVGGAWYVGNQTRLADVTYEHIPGYQSTIGFRCAAPAR